MQNILSDLDLEEKNAKYFVRTFKFLKVTYTNLGIEEKNAKYFARTKLLKVTYTNLGLEEKNAKYFVRTFKLLKVTFRRKKCKIFCQNFQFP